MNKYEEAIKKLKYLWHIDEWYADTKGKPIGILQELVDKAMPTELKDPYYEDGNVESGYCPYCGLEQDDGNKDAHCRDCGQALDWCIDA